MEPLFVHCPHCQQMCEIIELNCCIFRCGIYKSNQQQIPPHLPKINCDELVTRDLIYGCGKPFQITIYEENGEKKYKVVACDYI
jgi:hypothetical protein